MRRWSVVILCVAAVACSDPSSSPENDVAVTLDAAGPGSDVGALDLIDDSSGGQSLSWDPVNAGPYQVGYRTLTFSYDAVGHDDPRPITLSLWYPTDDKTGQPASYLGLLDDELAFQDATLADSAYGDTYPLHVHSHGHQGFAGSTNFLMRHFASHGWVVAAPDHAGNTLIDNIEPRPPWMYAVRPSDISATLDHLENLPEGDPLKDKMGTERVVMSGHSFGGYTAFVSDALHQGRMGVVHKNISGVGREVAQALFGQLL